MTRDLFDNENNEYHNFTIFQDEAGCKDSNFFYHGYLFVNNEFGREILDEVINAKGLKSKDSEITFKEIYKSDYRVRIVKKWLDLVDNWLKEGKIRFYVFGVDKNNLKNFWDNNWNFEKNIYLRFFEIGLNSSIKWFGNDTNLNKPIKISHIYYEHGDYDDERKNKIKWLKNLSGYKNSRYIYSNPKNQKIDDEKFCDLSNLIQLTDILLGITKYSFIQINENHLGKKECIDGFIDVIERFNNNKSAYRINSSYYKKYALQFFPTKNNLTKDEYLSNDINTLLERGNFYCDRKTHRQISAEKVNLKLFN
jgi:hypothetical protein